mmetsp:Transcript_9431/g.38179  ORF Transcript_9431/g.38179 Transcript_9431/m.38179 type:complete len:307 (-) Transcript_9431:25-945(-)
MRCRPEPPRRGSRGGRSRDASPPTVATVAAGELSALTKPGDDSPSSPAFENPALPAVGVANSSNDSSFPRVPRPGDSSFVPRPTPGVFGSSSPLAYPPGVPSSSSGVSPSESDAMDSSSIQFSGTCVASKLRRYCRRSLARLARSAGEVISDDDDDDDGAPPPLRGGRGGIRIRLSLSGIGSGGIFSLFRSGLSGPLRGPEPEGGAPPTGSAGFGCRSGESPPGESPPADGVFRSRAGTTRLCPPPNACPPANPHSLAGNTSDTGVLLNSPARSRSRSLASGAVASGSLAWLNDRRKRRTHAEDTS